MASSVPGWSAMTRAAGLPCLREAGSWKGGPGCSQGAFHTNGLSFPVALTKQQPHQISYLLAHRCADIFLESLGPGYPGSWCSEVFALRGPSEPFPALGNHLLRV